MHSRSTIEQLAITGIRSFSNKSTEVIRFNGPLSLIVGSNGSGKTTIIECLKYATTGKQPPNSGSAAFIHDPSLANEKEVLAMVKLGFKGAGGEPLVVARRLKCVVKKGNVRTMSTLEGSLATKQNGERTAISSSRPTSPRKSDEQKDTLLRLVPEKLGVSEAVLDNVIFCHQDESLWPMSTALELKKKFDLIFDALKYTKAVDNLRAMKKDKTIALGKMKIYEETHKVAKDKGERVRQRTFNIEAEMDEMKKQVAVIDEELKDALQLMNDKRQQASKASGYKNKLDSAKDQAEFLQRQIDEARKNLQELKESDEWLASTLAQYEERMAGYLEELEGYHAQELELGRSLANSRQQMSEKQAERGQHLAAKASYEDKRLLRARLVKEAASRHEIRGYDGDVDEKQIEEFIMKLRKHAKDKDRELARLKKSIDDELHQTRAAVEALGKQSTILTESKSNSKRQITENDRQSTRIQRDVDLIKIDEGRKAAIEAELQGVQDKKWTATQQFEVAKYDETLAMEQSRLRELDAEAERLRKELEQSAKVASERAQLDHKQNDLVKAKTSLETMISTYKGQLDSVLGADWKAESIETEYQAAVDQRNRTVADATRHQEALVRDMSQLEFKLKELRKGLKDKIELRKADEVVVLRSVTYPDGGGNIKNVDEYEEGLAAAEEYRNEAQKQISGCEYVGNYYQKCQDTIDKHDKCRLCDRMFAGSKEKSNAQAKLQKMIDSITKSALEKELKKAEAEYQKAAAARTQFARLKTVTEVEIPGMEKEIQEIEFKRSGVVRDVEKADGRVKEEVSAKQDVDKLNKTVTKISDYAAQISDREKDISRIKLQQQLLGTSLTSEELNKRFTGCSDKIRATRIKVDQISADKHMAKNALNALELEKSNVDRRLHETNNQLEKKQNLLNQLDMLRQSNLEQSDTIQRAEAELEALGPQIEKAKAKDGEAKARGQDKESQIRTDKERLADTVNKFDLVDIDINNYIDSRGPEKLARCQRAIQDLQDNQVLIEGDLTKVRQKADRLKTVVADSQITRNSIQNNISFRKNLRELEGYMKQIAELEARNVSGDFERLAREAEMAQKHHQNLFARRAPLLATLTEKDRQLAIYIEEWKSDYQNAAHQYRESHVNVETMKAAIQDIDKYRIALDQAIMRYHSLKMEEVNRIAGELWTNTYQGSDIDSIKIRSDPDTADSNNTSKRNYNYRVSMVKEDVEMDMRGRCSAGQKVLASIIIRLALAEVFGVGCGLIALDEPTTNLDKETIRSLATSLHAIIKARRAQRNFQLIVITHDEEFLKEMKCNEFTDIYYRVSRNDKQKSIIEEQSIGDLMSA